MKISFYTHIDALHLSFTTIDSREYYNNKSIYYKTRQITTTEGYTDSIAIYTNIDGSTIHFATVNHSKRITPVYSTLTLKNIAFYKPGWSNILNHIIADFVLNISIRKLEISIDTDKNILKKLHTVYMKTDKFSVLDNRYEFDNYGKTKSIKSQGYKEYFNNTATQILTNNATSTNSQFDRFENKRNEIDQSSHKTYIDDFLEQHFNTSNLYRWEKTLFFEDLTYKNPVYLNENTGEVLSKHHYKKLNNALKYNYTKHIQYNKLDIDFSQLESHNYLLSLFNHFALFNHQCIFNTDCAFVFRPHYVKSYKAVKPSTCSISIDETDRAIQKIIAEFDSINNIFTLPSGSTIDDYKQKQIDILFSIPMPSIPIKHRYGDWLI
jgi:hypothetical protein